MNPQDRAVLDGKCRVSVSAWIACPACGGCVKLSGVTSEDDDFRRIAETAFDLARHGETARLLAFVEAGLPVDLVNGSGDSLLMLAAYHGHAETVRALVGRGADAEKRNDRGQSPLAGAVFKGYGEVVAVLLEAGADPDAGSPSARQIAAMFDRDLLGGAGRS